MRARTEVATRTLCHSRPLPLAGLDAGRRGRGRAAGTHVQTREHVAAVVKIEHASARGSAALPRFRPRAARCCSVLAPAAARAGRPAARSRRATSKQSADRTQARYLRRYAVFSAARARPGRRDQAGARSRRPGPAPGLLTVRAARAAAGAWMPVTSVPGTAPASRNQQHLSATLKQKATRDRRGGPVRDSTAPRAGIRGPWGLWSPGYSQRTDWPNAAVNPPGVVCRCSSERPLGCRRGHGPRA